MLHIRTNAITRCHLNQDPFSSDLFPEIRLPPAPPKTRAPRASKTKAQPQTASTAPAKELTANTVPTVVALVPAHVVSPTDQDTEALAKVLEAHPDYRLLRRLKPRLHWKGNASADVLRVVVLDTETTGLDQSKDKIMELALLRFDLDTATGLPVGEVQVYDGLEDPGMPIPADVVAITGLTQADVAGHKLDEARIAELLRDVDLVIAHNAGFDRPFAEARIASFRQLSWACSFADIDWKSQGRSSAKLESLAQALGLFYDAHRAEMDCHALLTVLAQPLPVQGHTGFANLVQAAKHASYRLQANHAPFDAKDLLKARGYRWNADQKVWHTFLRDEAALEAECAWLKDHVYNHRAVVVQLEKLSAHVKYAQRTGELINRQL